MKGIFQLRQKNGAEPLVDFRYHEFGIAGMRFEQHINSIGKVNNKALKRNVAFVDCSIQNILVNDVMMPNNLADVRKRFEVTNNPFPHNLVRFRIYRVNVEKFVSIRNVQSADIVNGTC